MKWLMILLVAIMMLAVVGCGQQEAADDTKAPEGVAEAEKADVTAMDSAVVEEAPIDTMAAQTDSM
jgi:PBP1b-binding outer membrane lipoprotein LpoB